ncbi:hypothetical protein NL676_006097 [Syzygium grande]|nr:hypothetical protein NL676_006097 [Syzygium grande]
MWTHLGSVVAGLMFVWAVFKQYFPSQLRVHIKAYAHKAVGHNYLSASASARAKRLKAGSAKDSQSLILSLDEHEVVMDKFEGVKLWWSSNLVVSRNSTFSLHPPPEDKRQTSNRSRRDSITGSYIKHVLEKGKAVAANNRQRKLFTNNLSSNWHYYKEGK